MAADGPTEVLFVGGRSGVGKSTVAVEVSRLLAEADVRHAVVEGDALDLAYPEPWRQGLDLAERNLAAVWANYRQAGYRRLVYTNTVSVLESPRLVAALGGDVRVVRVLLRATDATAHERLAGRERGSGLPAHVARSDRAARELDERADDGVQRITTDGRSVAAIAREVLEHTGWT